jgi:hypothetical protein
MQWRLILVILGLAVFIPSLAAQDAAKKADVGQVRDEITASEQQIARQFADFEQALLKLTQRLKRSDKREDQERAKVLEKVLEESRTASITVQFERMVNALQGQKLNNPGEIKNLSDQSQKLADDLRKLLALMREDPRTKQVQDERKKLEQLLKDLDRIIHQQKGLQAQTDLGKTDPKELRSNQGKVSEATARLAKDLGKFGDKNDKGGEAKNQKGDPKDAGKGEGKAGESKDAGKEADAKRGESKDASKGEPKTAAKGAEGKQGDANKKGGEGAQSKEKGSKGPEGTKGEAKENKSGKGSEGTAKESPKGNEKPASKGADSPSQAKAKGGEPKEGAKGSKSESAKGEPKDGGQPKQGEAKSGQDSKGQSQAKGDGQSQQQQQSQQAQQKGEQQPNQPPQPQQPQDDVAQAKKRVEDGNYHQKRAEDELAKKKNHDASAKQNDAIKELEKAKKELEKLLRQMREEELERLLAALQARCEKMLAMQMQVLTGTEATHKSILANLDQKPKHENKQESLRLSDQEKDIVVEANKAMEMLEAEGSAVAFPEVFQQVREDMKHVQRRLEVTEVGSVTQTIERDIIETLKEMIEALKKARQELDSKQSKSNNSNSGPPPDQKLLDQIAELKMIRSLQLRVNARTQVYGKQYEANEGEQTADRNIRRELNNLAERQERIFDITNRIAKGENR